MRNEWKHVITGVALLSVCHAAQAQLYKCNQNGQTTFSSIPCGKDATAVKVRSTGGSSEAKPTSVSDGEKLCATSGVAALGLRDRDSAKFSVGGGQMVVIKWQDKPISARSYLLLVNAKNAFGAYTGSESYFCYTSEDGQRLLSSGKRVLEI